MAVHTDTPSCKIRAVYTFARVVYLTGRGSDFVLVDGLQVVNLWIQFLLKTKNKNGITSYTGLILSITSE